MESQRKFREADYEGMDEKEIKFSEALPENHLARFVVKIIEELDLSEIYKKYGSRGGMPYAPELLVGILLYGYITGVFSSRKIEQGTYESIPFRYIAGDLHPDHDTINEFRRNNLEELKGLFVQVLVLASTMGYLQLGNVSVDGSKVHADASKSHGMSYGRMVKLEEKLKEEVERLFALGAENSGENDLDIEHEVGLRQKKLLNISEAKRALEARARERYEAELAEYKRKMAAREEKERETGKKTRGRVPKEPEYTGPEEKEQYNFTDPESKIMKEGNGGGFEQSYNAQAAVDYESRFIVGNTLSNHPNDKQEGVPTIEAIPSELGRPDAAAMDTGYFSEETINGLEALGIEPYIAQGRESHSVALDELLGMDSQPLPESDSSILALESLPIALNQVDESDSPAETEAVGYKQAMAHKLATECGKAIYKLRKSTVEPVFGIIKEVMGSICLMRFFFIYNTRK